MLLFGFSGRRSAMFKNEAMLKKAINAVEQGVGRDEWGVGSYFHAQSATVVHYESPIGTRWMVVNRKDEYDKNLSCGIGLMMLAAGSTATRTIRDDVSLEKHLTGEYGITPLEIADLVTSNDVAGHQEFIATIRDMGFERDPKA